MSRPTFYIVQGSLRPVFRARIVDSAGNPVDLTEAESVTLNYSFGATRKSVECEVESPATSGWVTHEWEAGETDPAGEYQAQLLVEWGDGEEELPDIYPSDGYFKVEIAAAV